VLGAAAAAVGRSHSRIDRSGRLPLRPSSTTGAGGVRRRTAQGAWSAAGTRRAYSASGSSSNPLAGWRRRLATSPWPWLQSEEHSRRLPGAAGWRLRPARTLNRWTRLKLRGLLQPSSSSMMAAASFPIVAGEERGRAAWVCAEQRQRVHAGSCFAFAVFAAAAVRVRHKAHHPPTWVEVSAAARGPPPRPDKLRSNLSSHLERRHEVRGRPRHSTNLLTRRR